MTDKTESTKDPLDHLGRFHTMAAERKAQISPSWREGFGYAALPFVAGLFCLLSAWATWGRVFGDDYDHDPLTILIIGIVLVGVGLARRDVRVPVPLYGVLVDGEPVGLDWPDRFAMERRQASKQAILASWQQRYPNSVVEFVELTHAYVYVPRDLVEHSGARSLVSR